MEILDIKKKLAENPDKLRELLEYYDYHNIKIRNNYISFGRAKDSSAKSIVIQLNSYLYVTDYPQNINEEIFTYIINQRHTDFSSVISVVKSILNISDTDFYSKKTNKGKFFGGIYDNIKKKNDVVYKTYDDTILDKYENISNLRFLKDNISLEAQEIFDIRFDFDNQAIVIPVKSPENKIMGIKERFNYDVEDGQMKYFYDVPCQASLTLFGFAVNYEYLTDNTIYVFEAEKSVMQCYTYGIRNCVALGSGSVSRTQARLLYSLAPRRVILMHDADYDMDSIYKNASIIRNYLRLFDMDIGFWDWRGKNYPKKVSPSDMGGKVLRNIIKNEIKYIDKE